MKLAKSLLLGSAATLVVVAGASAADLPSKRAAPAQFVQVCTAYGAGFFTIPGTQTCVKLGGRARADYVLSAPQSVFAAAGATSGGVMSGTGYVNKDAVNVVGWEARGRIDVDARTPTGFGTVQAVASIRLARTSGLLNEVGAPSSGTVSSGSAGATLEAAFVRFAGFTFGAARDNFSFMPSTFYGAGHWASFANGAKQLAYTAVLGGGVSATLALQDQNDTLLAPGAIAPIGGTAPAGVTYSYNKMPQVNARLDWDQSWGTLSLLGALGTANGVTADGTTYDKSKTTYAVGAGLRLNLPMIAAGDTLHLNAAYAEGMHEYTINWTYFKSSDVRRNVGGYVTTDRSYYYGPNGIELPKSWNVAALFTHFWTPQWRNAFLASYGQIDGTTSSKAAVFSTNALGDTSVWNVGAQLAFLPVANFEIGVEALYARVEQDVRRSSTLVTKEKEGNWTGRLRVERTF